MQPRSSKVTLALRGLLASATFWFSVGLPRAQEPSVPSWAYPLNLGGPPKSSLENGAMLHVSGSSVGFTQSQIRDRFSAVDWRPEGHPAMPEVVAHGRAPDVFACGYCHYPNGQGRPENAALAGLSTQYIINQVAAMREGQRRSSQPAMRATTLMQAISAHASVEEVALAAAYFSALRYAPWIRVVETDAPPKVEIHGVSAYGAAPGGGTDPIGERIVEVPESELLTDLRDPGSGFIAYVAPGSIARGEALTHRSSGERQPCGTCHGAELRGTDIAPPLAGRSPSYLYRQLYDIQSGARSGPNVGPMKPEVAALTSAEMRDIVAYVASRAP